MKFKFVFSILLGASALGASAQGGYQDGVDYYNADRFEQAKIILNNTLNQPQTDKGVAYYYLGSIDLREGKTADAKAKFEEGIKAKPESGFNYIGLGEIALKNGDKKGAESQFKAAINTDKKNAALLAAVARAYFNVDPVTYKKEIDSNIAKAMKVSKNMESDVYVLQGDMAAKEHNVGEAAGKYEQAIEYDRQKGVINPEAFVKYANVYIKPNPDFAINKLKELNELLPTSALAQRELAEKYYDNNQFTLAAQQYGKYMSNPNHFQQDEQRYSGLLYFGQDYAKSLEVAENVLKKDPDNFYMYRMVMLNNAALKNYEAADAAAQKLFAAPGATFTYTDYVTYGDVLENLGQNEKALQMLEKAHATNPDKKDVLIKISAAYSGMKDYAKAAEFMQKYVDEAGDEASLQEIFVLSNRYKNLAISLPEGSDERKAAAQKGLEYVDMAIKDAATKAPLYRNRATLLMVRDGSTPTDELAETYKNMLAEYDKDPANKTKNVDGYKSAYNVLANYYLNKNDKATAREYYSKMLEVDPNNNELREYLKKF